MCNMHFVECKFVARKKNERLLRVVGVFRSLRMGHEVANQDVDAAINMICEESSPLEVDITHFVHR